MPKCPIDLVDAAAADRLADDKIKPLQKHLTSCVRCRSRLESSAASPLWWNDAARLLDEGLLDDPGADMADSSAADARLFEDDDPLGELKAAGVIDSPSHPEMLGQLGRYAIEREIGSGGMGVVLKGFDAELNRTVAIKVLAPHLARSSAARQRFIREGRAAAAVVHENIVAIHEVDTTGRLPNLVMHFVDGVSLQRHVDTIGPLPVCDALRIGAQSAAGLAAAHRQGIIHRDVKPANIMIGGGGQRVWITDFGLARAVDDASLTRTGFIAGTPHYMSPEQARGGSVGPVSDLFSLGAVIYFMLAARPPWRAERSLAVLHRIVEQPHRPLWQVNPDVPREVSDLVDRLLCKSPEGRGESADKIQAELEQMLSQMQNPDHPHSLVGSQVETAKPSFFSHPAFVAPLTALVTTMAIYMLLPLAGWNLFGWNLRPEANRINRNAVTIAPPRENAIHLGYERSAATKPVESFSQDPSRVRRPSLQASQQNTFRTGDANVNRFDGFGTRSETKTPFASTPGLVTQNSPSAIALPPPMPKSTNFDPPNATPIVSTTSEISTTKETVWSEISLLEELLRDAETNSPWTVH
ncbi:serine/threonine-protein kinase [Planctomycetes bacterium K23_9]|uniref:non-specific serine/threonine protein kinase n=1 Tax=Stieleria marina TaxID=1930275 RepID=A0A517P3E9_9BACT|nr:Serine/threonine-protein kinase PrkC [Planctomycetes bacterium K23_9]